MLLKEEQFLITIDVSLCEWSVPSMVAFYFSKGKSSFKPGGQFDTRQPSRAL